MPTNACFAIGRNAPWMTRVRRTRMQRHADRPHAAAKLKRAAQKQCPKTQPHCETNTNMKKKTHEELVKQINVKVDFADKVYKKIDHIISEIDKGLE